MSKGEAKSGKKESKTPAAAQVTKAIAKPK